MADIAFSDHAIVAPYGGITAFEFRIANRRRNQIIELNARVFLSLLQREDNVTRRRIVELDLERSSLAFFPLTWTVVHPITENSPMYGQSQASMEEAGAEVLITLTGIDETSSQTVHSRTSYTADEFAWSAQFENIYERTSSGNPSAIDISRIDEFAPA